MKRKRTLSLVDVREIKRRCLQKNFIPLYHLPHLPVELWKKITLYIPRDLLLISRGFNKLASAFLKYDKRINQNLFEKTLREYMNGSLRKESKDVIKAISKYKTFGFDITFGGNKLFGYYSTISDSSVLNYLLEDCNIAIKEESIVQSLHSCCERGYTETAKLLFRKCETSSNSLHSCLRVSCYSGKTRIVKMLFEEDNRSLLNPSYYNNELVYIAADNSHYEIVQLLMNHPRFNKNEYKKIYEAFGAVILSNKKIADFIMTKMKDVLNEYTLEKLKMTSEFLERFADLYRETKSNLLKKGSELEKVLKTLKDNTLVEFGYWNAICYKCNTRLDSITGSSGITGVPLKKYRCQQCEINFFNLNNKKI